MTGQSPEDPTWEYGQAETSMAVGISPETSNPIVTIAFNDDTAPDGTITYTETGRVVTKGASLMGWSYSEDLGETWNYGGKVSPPPGWAVWWGDPALTAMRPPNNHVMILSGVAGKEEGFPEDGVSGGMTHLTGACLAISENGGKNFAPLTCLTDEDHFYDGGSITAVNESVFALSYLDTNTAQTDVWVGTTISSVPILQHLPSPFGPPVRPTNGHPIVRSIAGGASAPRIYVLAPFRGNDGDGLSISYFNGSSWSLPKDVEVPGLGFEQGPDFTGSDSGKILRTARNYDFDVGFSDQGAPEVRILAGIRVNGVFEVRGIRCDENLTDCNHIPSWRAFSGTHHRYQPRIMFAGINSTTGRSVWKASFDSIEVNNSASVAMWQGNLTATAFSHSQLTSARTVCSDRRGYWGDYNEFALLPGTPFRFIHAFTDSNRDDQECLRYQYTATPQHVSSVFFQ